MHYHKRCDMIRDVKVLEEFETELIRSEKANFSKNLKDCQRASPGSA